MNQSIWDDIKRNVIYSNNTLIQLIGINLGLFILMAIPMGFTLLAGPDVFESAQKGFAHWFLLQGSFTDLLFRPWTLITHFFLHSFDLMHVGWNMITFWIFGRIYHSLMGNERTIQLYMLSGITGGLAFMVAANLLPTLSPENHLVGASGAVMGFVIGATTLNPQYTIRLMFLGDLKLWWIAVFFVVVDLMFIADNTGGHVAHLFGGLMGYIFVSQLRKGNDLGAWVTKALNLLKGLGRSKPKSQFQTHRNTNYRQNATSKGSSFSNAVTQAEIDAVLDKIKESGYESLSSREKDILFKASNE